VIDKNFPWPLDENVLGCLAPALRDDAPQIYMSAIDEELARCSNDHPADRQQWLWQMSGIGRYIFGLGYFDEEFIEVRRPLMSRIVLDQWVRAPWRLRINKNLFVQTIARNYPRLFRFGRNHVSSIADYYHYMAEHVRESTLDALRAGFDLDGLLDPQRCLELVEAFRPQERPRYLPGWKARQRLRLEDRHAWRFYRTRWYREHPVKRLHTSDVSLTFHLYLLINWFHSQRYRSLSPGV